MAALGDIPPPWSRWNHNLAENRKPNTQNQQLTGKILSHMDLGPVSRLLLGFLLGYDLLFLILFAVTEITSDAKIS
jgi:hypothetical protein